MNAVVQAKQDAPTGATPAKKATRAKAAGNNAANAPSSDAAAAGSNVTPIVRKPPRGINGFKVPDDAYRAVIHVSLRSHEVIKLAEVGFAHAHESFYNIENVLPHYQNENLDRIKATEDAMNALVGVLAADMANELKRVRRLAKEGGVELSNDNYKPQHHDVEVGSKYAAQLLGIITNLDELNHVIQALQFNSVISNTERVRLFAQWRNRLTKFMRSLKHHYYLLKQRGELPAEPGAGEDITTDRLQHELDKLDEATQGDVEKEQAAA